VLENFKVSTNCQVCRFFELIQHNQKSIFLHENYITLRPYIRSQKSILGLIVCSQTTLMKRERKRICLRNFLHSNNFASFNKFTVFKYLLNISIL